MASLRPLVQIRPLSTSGPRRAGNPFFALHKLSNGRETQHLNKISKLRRVEHSPALQLIEDGEVKPYVTKTDGGKEVVRVQGEKQVEVKSTTKDAVVAVETTSRVERTPSRSSRQEAEIAEAMSEAERILKDTPVWDERALAAGRAILAEKDEQIARLTKALHRRDNQKGKILDEAQFWKDTTVSLDNELAKTRENESKDSVLNVLLSVVVFGIGVAIGHVVTKDDSTRLTMSEQIRQAREREMEEFRKQQYEQASVIGKVDMAIEDAASAVLGRSESPGSGGGWFSGWFWKRH